MANREYEMLFKLGAQLGSNFQGTFSSAQQILTDTQKKIQTLNQLQSDIGAYQRQQSGIDKTQQKLELYKNQLTNTQNALAIVRKEMEKGSSASANLAAKESELLNKELALKNRINDTEVALSDKNARLQQMGQKLTDAGVNTESLTAEVTKLNKEITELGETEAKAATETAKIGEEERAAAEAVRQRAEEEKALADAAAEAARQRSAAAKEAAQQQAEAAKVASAGAAATLAIASKVEAGLKRVYDSYAECVKISSQFESTMSSVEALSGASAQEMAALSAEAKRLGAETVFTANESATAMTYMGMAGWKAEEMLSGMNGVMALAAASGEDLGLVSDIVTDNLTAFGLTAKDTARFSDVLASAASNTNTSVAIMGETFSNSAAIAGALGYSIEDVAVAVGAMANAGVKGSVAGTALKNIFNGLLDGVTLTGKAFGECEFTAVNADGTMKSFGETLNELREYFDKMTDSERANNAVALAGKYGYNGLLAILNMTGEEYQSLTNTINNCSGAAQRMADIKLDNLSGDVTLLQSAAEGLKISIGGLYRDELRGLAQMATQVLGSIQKLIEENPALAKTILAIAGGIGAVVGVYTALNALKKARNALDTISTALRLKNTAATAAETVAEGANATATAGATAAHKALNLAMLANPAVIITGTVIALTAALMAWREASKTASIEEQSFSTALQANNGEIERLNESYKNACEQYGETSDQARALKYDIDEATTAIEEQSFSVSQLFNEIDALHSSTSELLSVYSETENTLSGNQESAHILAAKLKEIANSSETAATKQAMIEPIIKKLNALYPTLGLTVENVADKMNGLSDAIDNAANAEGLQAKYEAAKKTNAELIVQEKQLAEAVQKAEIVQSKAREKFLSTTGNGNVFVSLVGTINGAATSARDEMEKAQDAASQAYADLNAVRAQIEENNAILKEYGETISGTGEEATTAYTATSIAIAQVKEATENLVAAYNDAYSAAFDSVSGQYALWDTAAAVVPTSIYTINSALSSQVEYWDKYNANLETLAKRADGIEGLSDIIAGFADGSKDSVNAIAGMANASDAELKKMVESYAKLKEEQDKTAKSLADVKTDFDNQMDEISAKMSDTISGMTLDDEAAAAAKATIQAYANAIREGKGLVVEAAEAVQAATRQAFDSQNESTKVYSGVVIPAQNHYATGTDYAQAGFALVGEEGPEIVYMNGGEKVVNAENTRAILSGQSQSTTITISPIFTINNNGGEIDDKQVAELSERLVSNVMDALEEAGIDRRRAVYS